jgi:hypothetical protein
VSQKCGSIFAWLCVLLAGASPVLAQAGFITTAGGFRYKASHDPGEVRALPLKREPDLPDVPRYSGKGVLFVDGIYHPEMNNGRKCVQGRYRAKEDARYVLSFYKNALPSNGWKMEDNQCGRVEVAARKMDQGLTVFVRARDITDATYKSEYFIRYTIVPVPKSSKQGTS